MIVAVQHALAALTVVAFLGFLAKDALRARKLRKEGASFDRLRAAERWALDEINAEWDRQVVRDLIKGSAE